MPGTPSSAIQLPQVLLARIMASATIRSSGAPRWRVLICTVSALRLGAVVAHESKL
jgi:hypothetical protein